MGQPGNPGLPEKWPLKLFELVYVTLWMSACPDVCLEVCIPTYRPCMVKLFNVF